MHRCIAYVQVLGFLSSENRAMTGAHRILHPKGPGGLGSGSSGSCVRSASSGMPVRSDGGVASDGSVPAVVRMSYRKETYGTEHVKMPNPALKILPLVLAFGLSACAGQNEPQPITAEPVLNKFGDVQLCVGSDGRTFPPRPELQNPCTPISDQQILGVDLRAGLDMHGLHRRRRGRRAGRFPSSSPRWSAAGRPA
jgi:hypothetical protein